MGLSTNEKNTLRKLWPNMDWPQELEQEHDRRVAVLKKFGIGYALNNQQMYDLAVLFTDEEGQPICEPRDSEEAPHTPYFTGAMAKEDFDDRCLVTDAAGVERELATAGKS